MTKNKIGELLRARKPGLTLPGEFYTSPEAFKTDLDVFFHKHWIVIGFDADVPEPGDVRAIDIGLSSLIIVRDDDQVVRAFHNVCRHRGARLVNEERASVGRLICPYHQWSYDLNGDLVYASQMGRNFDKSCHGLRPLHLRSVGGILMTCLSDEAPDDIEDLIAVMEPRLAPHDLRNTKIAHETKIVEDGNWKLSVDNNRECYHCAGSHPELSRSITPLDIGFDPDEVSEEELKEWNDHNEQNAAEAARWEEHGFPSMLAEEMIGRATIFRSQRFTIADTGESHTIDTRAACRKLLGEIPFPRLGGLHYWTHNSWCNIFADHAVLSYIVPLAPDRTLLRTVWLVHKDAQEGVDYDLKRLTEVWEATNRQDADLVALAHRGVASAGYTPGPLSIHAERLVNLNLDWYVERLHAHGY
jgi:glycine betaine catabolism A